VPNKYTVALDAAAGKDGVKETRQNGPMSLTRRSFIYTFDRLNPVPDNSN
jgi:hypothetical protein